MLTFVIVTEIPSKPGNSSELSFQIGFQIFERSIWTHFSPVYQHVLYSVDKGHMLINLKKKPFKSLLEKVNDGTLSRRGKMIKNCVEFSTSVDTELCTEAKHCELRLRNLQNWRYSPVVRALVVPV